MRAQTFNCASILALAFVLKYMCPRFSVLQYLKYLDFFIFVVKMPLLWQSLDKWQALTWQPSNRAASLLMSLQVCAWAGIRTQCIYSSHVLILA